LSLGAFYETSAPCPAGGQQACRYSAAIWALSASARRMGDEGIHIAMASDEVPQRISTMLCRGFFI